MENKIRLFQIIATIENYSNDNKNIVKPSINST